jgi:hypothetical protein
MSARSIGECERLSIGSKIFYQNREGKLIKINDRLKIDKTRDCWILYQKNHGIVKGGKHKGKEIASYKKTYWPELSLLCEHIIENYIGEEIRKIKKLRSEIQSVKGEILLAIKLAETLKREGK